MILPSFAVVELLIRGANADERMLEIGIVFLNPQGMIERRWAMEVAYGDASLPVNAAKPSPVFEDIASYIAILLRGRILVASDIDLVGQILRDEYRRLGVQLPADAFGISLQEHGVKLSHDNKDMISGDYLEQDGLYSGSPDDYQCAAEALERAEELAATFQLLLPYLDEEFQAVVPLVLSERDIRQLKYRATRKPARENQSFRDGGSPLTRRDFAELFPWFLGADNDVDAVVYQWIAEYRQVPLYKISPVLNPRVLPEGFDRQAHYVRRWLAHFPKPLYATIDDVLGGQYCAPSRVEAFVRTVVLHAVCTGFLQQHPTEFPKLLSAAELLAGWLDLHQAWPNYRNAVNQRGNYPELLVDAMTEMPQPAEQLVRRAIAEIQQVVAQEPEYYPAVLSGRSSGIATTDELAEKLATSRERIRQLEYRIAERIRNHSPYCALLACAVLTRFYPCARVATILSAMPLVRDIPLARDIDDTHMQCTLFEVLCWVYARSGVPNTQRANVRWEIIDGWLVCDEFAVLLTNLMKHLPDQFGIVKTATLLAQLERRSGAHYTSELLPYVLHQHRYRELGPVLIPLDLSIAQAAGVELTLHGEPMTTQQLCERIPHRNASSIVSALSASEKFFRCGTDRWALTGWDYEEWTNLADLLSRRIAQRGGEAPLEWLVAQAAKFGIARSSVVTYLRGPEFVVSDHHQVRLNELEPVCQQLPETSTSMYFHNGAWMQLITVTADHLRGSGNVVHQSVVNVYGLKFNEPTKIPSRLGPQTIRWGRTNCMLGTVRRFLHELGAEVGDRVFFVYGETFDVIPAAALDLRLRGKREVLNFMGFAERPGENIFETINLALGLPANALRTAAIERFLARGDRHIAEKLRWA